MLNTALNVRKKKRNAREEENSDKPKKTSTLLLGKLDHNYIRSGNKIYCKNIIRDRRDH